MCRPVVRLSAGRSIAGKRQRPASYIAITGTRIDRDCLYTIAYVDAIWGLLCKLHYRSLKTAALTNQRDSIDEK